MDGLLLHSRIKNTVADVVLVHEFDVPWSCLWIQLFEESYCVFISLHTLLFNDVMQLQLFHNYLILVEGVLRLSSEGKVHFVLDWIFTVYLGESDTAYLFQTRFACLTSFYSLHVVLVEAHFENLRNFFLVFRLFNLPTSLRRFRLIGINDCLGAVLVKKAYFTVLITILRYYGAIAFIYWRNRIRRH